MHSSAHRAWWLRYGYWLLNSDLRRRVQEKERGLPGDREQRREGGLGREDSCGAAEGTHTPGRMEEH